MPDFRISKEALGKKHCVYVAWSKPQAIYVGCSSQGITRPLTNQTLKQVWNEIDSIEVEWLSTPEEAHEREIIRIRELQPNLNKVRYHQKFDELLKRPASKVDRPFDFTESFNDQVQDFQRQLIRAALTESHGVRTKAASLLKMTYRQFRHLSAKLKP